MARFTIKEDTLDELVPLYAQTKELENQYKKSAKEYNDKIKDIFKDSCIESFIAGGYCIKLVTQDRSTLNEEEVIYKNDNSSFAEDLEAMGIIKTKRVVDLDELESAIYKGDLSQSTIDLLNVCWTEKTVQTLKVSKAKEVK